ncbi:uncharacterized protein JCM6883_007242 [Sporobolomyces salmoneus]|uniref:uncharacterized protein n=1 Tax=Sporobolomyces salmoneus TaxID=183962 RepID=UPI003178F8ED
MSTNLSAPSSHRSTTAVSPTTNRKVSLKDLVLAAAGASVSIYDNLFDDGRGDAIPVLTGWLACMVAAGKENGSEFTRAVLEKCLPHADFGAECVILRRTQTSAQRDQSAKEEVKKFIQTRFPENRLIVEVTLSERFPFPEPITFVKPFLLDVDLSPQDLEACYALYSTRLNGISYEFKLLSGPLFILTRLKFGIQDTRRRSDMWEELLVYLTTVQTLPKGRLREGFQLVDHEKWIELVVGNPGARSFYLRKQNYKKELRR